MAGVAVIAVSQHGRWAGFGYTPQAGMETQAAHQSKNEGDDPLGERTEDWWFRRDREREEGIMRADEGGPVNPPSHDI